MRELLAETNAYRIVKRDAERNALSHAYLLVFPDAKYLRFALKEFAKLFFSSDGRISELIDKEYFSDCKVYPEAGKRLNVDCASALIEDSKVLPVEGENKVYLLDQFQEAGPAVQNKLLKVLEEPPRGVYFLLGATSPFPVLPTVLSRVRQLVLPPFTQEQVFSYLRRNFPEREREALSDYAASSGGVVSEAETLLNGSYYGEMLSLCRDIVKMKESDLPFLVRRALSFPQKGEFLSLLRLVFREILMYNSNGKPLLRGISLKKESSEYSAAACVAILESLAVAERDMKFNASYPQLLENLLMTIKRRKFEEHSSCNTVSCCGNPQSFTI